MVGLSGDKTTTVAIKSEQTLWRTQQATIEIALPIEFRRSPFRRLQSALLPALVFGFLLAALIWNYSGKPDPNFSLDVYYRYLPGMSVLLVALAVLGFIFLHYSINWLANLLLDSRGGACVLIDAKGVTDRRVSMRRIDWADVDGVDMVTSRGGIDEVELALKAGAQCQFRAFRLDYRLFNAIARPDKVAVVGIDVRYFDTDSYVIASVIEALAKRRCNETPNTSGHAAFTDTCRQDLISPETPGRVNP